MKIEENVFFLYCFNSAGVIKTLINTLIIKRIDSICIIKNGPTSGGHGGTRGPTRGEGGRGPRVRFPSSKSVNYENLQLNLQHLVI